MPECGKKDVRVGVEDTPVKATGVRGESHGFSRRIKPITKSQTTVGRSVGYSTILNRQNSNRTVPTYTKRHDTSLSSWTGVGSVAMPLPYSLAKHIVERRVEEGVDQIIVGVICNVSPPA